MKSLFTLLFSTILLFNFNFDAKAASSIKRVKSRKTSLKNQVYRHKGDTQFGRKTLGYKANPGCDCELESGHAGPHTCAPQKLRDSSSATMGADSFSR